MTNVGGRVFGGNQNRLLTLEQLDLKQLMVGKWHYVVRGARQGKWYYEYQKFK